MLRQKKPLRCSPQTGDSLDKPQIAKDLRRLGLGAWLFNPWTGERRSAKEVGDDVFGHNIRDGVAATDAVLTAIRNGDAAASVLKAMDDIGCPIDEPIGDHGEPALMIAAYHGHLDLVEALLRRGANPRGRGQGVSVLCFGARHSQVLKILLNTEARLDLDQSFPPSHFTPLMQALNLDNASGSFLGFDLTQVPDRLICIRLLLDQGADVDAQNGFGRTALMNAAYSGVVEFAQELLKHDPRLDIVDNKGSSAIGYARSPEMTALLRAYELSSRETAAGDRPRDSKAQTSHL